MDGYGSINTIMDYVFLDFNFPICFEVDGNMLQLDLV